MTILNDNLCFLSEIFLGLRVKLWMNCKIGLTYLQISEVYLLSNKHFTLLFQLSLHCHFVDNDLLSLFSVSLRKYQCVFLLNYPAFHMTVYLVYGCYGYIFKETDAAVICLIVG